MNKIMGRQFSVFLLRWVLSSFGLWLSVRLLGTGYTGVEVDQNFWLFILAGLVFSVVNSIIKPIIVILSLPAILISLGLFMLVVNGIMVYISLKLVPGIAMSFVNSILAGMILSLINYIVSSAIEITAQQREKL